jgi:hypothetical protein
VAELQPEKLPGPTEFIQVRNKINSSSPLVPLIKPFTAKPVISALLLAYSTSSYSMISTHFITKKQPRYPEVKIHA